MAPSAILEPTPTTATPTATSKAKTTAQQEPETNQDAKPKTALQLISQGTTLPGIPTHPSYAAHRSWMLSKMALAFRVFARKGYTEGMSGHISVRDPENPHTFWTNPLSKHFGLLEASDMILVDYDGNTIGGNMALPANAAGFLIHSAVHKARPDVVAACHTHSPYGKAWSAFGRRLEMLNQDVTYFYGEAQAVYEVSCSSVCSFLFKPGSPVKAWSYAILTRWTAGIQRCRLLRRRRRASRRRSGAQRQRLDPAQPRTADSRRDG